MKHAPVTNTGIKIVTLVFSLALVSAVLIRAGSAVASGGKCTIAVKGNSPTAKACTKGGRDEAKRVMNQMVRAAKAKGGKFSCAGCHQDLESFELTKDATEEYKKLQAASGIY
jgi:Na+-transporting NADH:ubiquinone oxidoreductase subunit NqrF